ncbi:MAG: leucine-rich repeat domain-containing protein, partial [archaeon]
MRVKGREEFEKKYVKPYSLSYESLERFREAFTDTYSINMLGFDASDSAIVSTILKAAVRHIIISIVEKANLMTEEDDIDYKSFIESFFKYTIALMDEYLGALDFSGIDDAFYKNVLVRNNTFEVIDNFAEDLEEFENHLNNGTRLREAYRRGVWWNTNSKNVKNDFFYNFENIVLKSDDYEWAQNIIFAVVAMHTIFYVKTEADEEIWDYGQHLYEDKFLELTTNLLKRYRFVYIDIDLDSVFHFWKDLLSEKYMVADNFILEYGDISKDKVTNNTIANDDTNLDITFEEETRPFSKDYDRSVYQVPEGIRRISNFTFHENEYLIKVIIPNTVEEIGDFAFNNVKFLQTITFEDNSQLKIIGKWAFSSMKLLTSIVIPNGVFKIGEYAFNDVDSLTIYAEAKEKPADWESTWNSQNLPVKWGIKDYGTYNDLDYVVLSDDTVTILGQTATSEATSIDIPETIDGLDVTT